MNVDVPANGGAFCGTCSTVTVFVPGSTLLHCGGGAPSIGGGGGVTSTTTASYFGAPSVVPPSSSGLIVLPPHATAASRSKSDDLSMRGTYYGLPGLTNRSVIRSLSPIIV